MAKYGLYLLNGGASFSGNKIDNNLTFCIILLIVFCGKIHIATYAHDFITYLITLQIGGGDGYQ